MDNPIYLECPNCGFFFETSVGTINCSIFRHGVFINTNIQMNPHAPKNVCDDAYNNRLIYGCGKPFKIIKNLDGSYTAQKCDYI